MNLKKNKGLILLMSKLKSEVKTDVKEIEGLKEVSNNGSINGSNDGSIKGSKIGSNNGSIKGSSQRSNERSKTSNDVATEKKEKRERLTKKAHHLIRNGMIQKSDLCAVFEMFCQEKDKVSNNKTKYFIILNNYNDQTIDKVYDYLTKVEAVALKSNSQQQPSYKSGDPGLDDDFSNRPMKKSEVNIMQLLQNRPNLMAPRSDPNSSIHDSMHCSTSINDLKTIKMGSNNSSFFVSIKKQTNQSLQLHSKSKPPEPIKRVEKKGPTMIGKAAAANARGEELPALEKLPIKDRGTDRHAIERRHGELREMIAKKMQTYSTIDQRLLNFFDMRPMSKDVIKHIMDSKKTTRSHFRGKSQRLVKSTAKLNSRPVHFIFKDATSIFMGPKYDEITDEVETGLDAWEEDELEDEDEEDEEDDIEIEEPDEEISDFEEKSDFSEEEEEEALDTDEKERLEKLKKKKK
jgi:hypothetical protein